MTIPILLLQVLLNRQMKTHPSKINRKKNEDVPYYRAVSKFIAHLKRMTKKARNHSKNGDLVSVFFHPDSDCIYERFMYEINVLQKMQKELVSLSYAVSMLQIRKEYDAKYEKQYETVKRKRKDAEEIYEKQVSTMAKKFKKICEEYIFLDAAKEIPDWFPQPFLRGERIVLN